MHPDHFHHYGSECYIQRGRTTCFRDWSNYLRLYEANLLVHVTGLQSYNVRLHEATLFVHVTGLQSYI